MANLKQKFGTRPKLLRTQKGTTRELLVAQTDLAIESISNMERGIFGPRFGNVEKIAAVVDVEVKRLFEF